MTFIEYIKYRNPIGSFRAKLFIVKYKLQGNDTLETLIKYDSIGKKSAKSILELQRKYLSK